MSLALWRDISLIWLLLLCFLGLLIPLAVSFAAVWGMHKALSQTRVALSSAQGISRLVRQRTDSVSESVVQPVIRSKRWAARTRESVRAFARGKSS